MKLHQIAFAVAALAAAGSVAAATQTVWSSGASAPTKTVFNAFRSNCLNGAVTVHQAGSTVGIPGDTGTGNFFRYSCTFDGAKTAVYSGDTVNMYHTVDGGSFNAFTPYLNPANPEYSKAGQGQYIKRVDETSAVCVSAGTTAGVTTFKNCGTIDPANNPDGGFADVEDDLWPNLMTYGENFTTASANVAQLFGVVVTDELYKAMQAAQGLVVGVPVNPAALTAADIANQPSISKDMYASIASQSASGQWHTDWSALVGAAGTGKNVNLCRRVDTSGTQASSNAYFLANPCADRPGVGGLLAPATVADATGTSADAAATGSIYRIKENSSTSDVKGCLNKVNAGFDPLDQAVSQGTKGTFGIGVVSAENVPGTSDKFKLVKLDGISPNADAKQRAAGAQGKYGFVMETVYVVHNPIQQSFFEELAADMGDPAGTDLTGIFVLPTTGATYDGDKVGRGTKLGNNCRPQQLFF
ncbi:MAG: hypothetical protein K0M66_14795 [Thiobacillus sp.]|nr:hypothetical protein [Thiobacillus sp.]